MRSPLRAASLLALAALALSCTDAPTAPGAGQRGALRAANLRMSPSFSPQAARAFTALTSLGIQLTAVRVRLVDEAGVVVKDTTIDFPADRDTLNVSIPVQIVGTEQSLNATIDLSDANGVVFFSHTQQVTARDASLPAAPAPVIVLQFVGPGASARTMTLTPATATVAPGTSPVLTAAALDGDGHAVADLLVSNWTSSDPTIATIDRTTDVSATVHGTGKRGAVTFTGSTLGSVTATAQLTFLPQAAQLTVVNGAGQTGPAGHELPQPFVVQLLGVDGLAIADQPVTFRAVTTGGQVATASATTDAAGKAQTAFTPGRTPGAFAFDATAGALTATVQVTAVAGPPSQLVVTQPFPTSLSVGVVPAPAFRGQVSDDMGNPAAQANVTVNAAVSVAPSGRTYSATGTSDAGGVVSIALPAYVGPVGTATISLTSPTLGPISTTTVPMTAGPAATLQIVQQPAATAASGATLPTVPTVQLADAGGNPVATAMPVTVSLGDGQTGTLGGTTTVTSASDGRVSFPGLSISAAVGSYTLKFAAGTLQPTTSTAIALGAGVPAKLAWVTLPPDQITVGEPVAPTPRVRIADAQGNAVHSSGVKVRTRGSGPDGVSLDSVVTDANGEADLPATPYRGHIGTLRFSVTSDGVDSLVRPIVAVAGAPAALTVVQPPPATAVSGVAMTPAPVVQVVDVGGNAVTATLTVTVSVVESGATLSGSTQHNPDAAGRATFDGLAITGPSGSYTLRFSSGTLTPVTTSAIAVGPGAATQLVALSATSQSGTVATAATVQPTVKVADAAGNGVPGVSVSFAPSSGSTVNGGPSADVVSTDANGQATARGWTLGTAAGSYSIDVSVSGISGGPVRFTATAVAGAPSRYVVTASSSSAAAGQSLTVTAQLVDVHDNPVRSNAHTVSWSVSPAGSGGFSASATQTDANGLATVSYTAPSTAPASVVVSAAESGLTGSSAPISITAGSAAVLGLSWSTPSSTAAGAGFAPQPVIQARDANGNAVAVSGLQVTATIASGPAGATLSGATATTNVQGQASFTGLALGGPTGTYTLAFNASGYVPATSGSISLAAGPAASVSAIAGDGQTAAPGASVAVPPAVAVRDQYGNPVAGVAVTFSTVDANATVSDGTVSGTSATVMTNASGNAALVSWTLGTVSGAQHLDVATSPALTPVAFTATAVATTPTKLGILVAPAATAASGAPLTTQPEIVLLDANGNRVAQAGVNVSAVLASGTGSERQNTAVTDATGAATFTSLTLIGTAGPVTVRFDATGIASVTSGTITLTAGAAQTLAVTTEPPATAQSRIPFTQQPAVALRDGGGNAVAQAGVVVTATIAGGTGTVANGTATTDAAGVAQFSGLTVTGDVARLSLTFTSGTMTATSTPFDLQPTPVGPATHFVVVDDGGGSGTVTTSLARPVVIEARDAYEQPVPGVAMAVNYNFDTDQGVIRVAGVNYACDCIARDSVNTDASGRASFTWQLSYHAKIDSVYVENDSIAATLVTAKAVAGDATTLIFVAPSGLDDDLGNVLTPFQVVFTDIGGYDTVAVNGPVTITLTNALSCDGTCPPPSVSGTMTVNAVNGVATFDDIKIGQTGTFYFTATSGSLVGTSDWFDISPVGPHFVVVSPYPTNNLVGSTVQIQLRSQTAHGDVLPNTPVLASTNEMYGSVHLQGGDSGGTRDSSRTDANGLITLSWTMPSSPGSELLATVYNHETAQNLQLLANSVAGPPAMLVPSSDGYDDDAGSMLNTIRVKLTDAAGNQESGVSGTVTVELIGGDPAAKLTGTLTLPFGYYAFVDFDDLIIDTPGLGYKLRFTSGSIVAETPEFDISPAPTGATVGSIAPAASAQLLMKPSSTGTLSFLVKDGGGAPLANQHVAISSSAPATCYFGAPGTGTRTTYTDASGIATATLSSAATNGGCHISASASDASSTVNTDMEAVSYEGAATHVWFGNGSADGGFDAAANWIRRVDGQPSVPGTADRPFMPANTANYPQVLSGDHTLAGLEMESGATFALGGTNLLVTGNVALPSGAFVADGTVTVTGTSTVSGYFYRLTLGQTGCANDQFTMSSVQTSHALTVRCHATAGADISADSLIVLPGADLAMSGPASQIYVNYALVQGTAFSMDGTFNAGTNAVLTPSTLTMAPTTQLSVGSDLQLGANGASQLTLAGQIYVQGTLLEAGRGTSTADAITVLGNAMFDGNAFTLPSGVLAVGGDLRTASSYSQMAFQASGDHLTRFIGNVAQSAAFTYTGDASSHLAKVRIENTTAAVTFPYAMTIAAGPDSLRLELLPNTSLTFGGAATVNGNVHVGNGASLTLNGGLTVTSPAWLRLFDRATFIVNSPVDFTGQCTDTYNGVQALNLTIGGTGLINGQTPNKYSCTAS